MAADESIDVADVVGPQHLQRGRERRGGDAGQARRAAELPPLVGRRGSR